MQKVHEDGATLGWAMSQILWPSIWVAPRFTVSGRKHKIEPGLSADNFVAVNEIGELAMIAKNIPQAPMLQAEGGAAIIGTIYYAADRDVLLGFCEPAGAGHQCVDGYEVHVGEGQKAYQNIV